MTFEHFLRVEHWPRLAIGLIALAVFLRAAAHALRGEWFRMALFVHTVLVFAVGQLTARHDLIALRQPAILPHMKCDGLWMGDDGTRCPAPVVSTCACSRCDRESDDEKFHACAGPAHRRVAGQRHERVRGRPAVWALRKET